MTLDGDVDGDGVADVTLDGAAVTGQRSPLFINVSNTTARHLVVHDNEASIPVLILAEPGVAITNVALIDIEATRPPQEYIPAIGAFANAMGGQASSLRDILISNCQFNDGRIFVAVNGDDGTGLGEIHRITIVGNVGNAPKNAIGIHPFRAHKSVITQVVVANNTVRDVNEVGISLYGPAGEGDGSDNMVEGTISENTITNVGQTGISVRAGTTSQGASTGNTVIAQIHDNQIIADTAIRGGITITGASGTTEDKSLTTKNMVIVNVQGNEIRDSLGPGILITGGFGHLGPTTQNYATGEIQNNSILKSKNAAILAAGGWSASESTTEVMIANNTVMDPGSNGIEINGGTARDLRNNRQGASNNTALGTVQDNTVQASTFSDIAVFGGSDNSAGAVTNNLAEQTIRSNNARSGVCQDGLAGNIARCTFADAGTEAATTTQREEKAITVQPAVVPLLNQLDEHLADLRTHALGSF